ncbi:MAG: hypothetical protein KGL39_30285, partial [Patescibacteria group bacterium]|nr:hypothetical protein [Patescibacteria group bacterium]
MSYQVISNFVGGLDARKFFLSLPPGTLTQLVNGHITQGGEIEKRKIFAQNTLPVDTFGAQPTNEGITIFGSRSVLSWTSNTQSIVNASGVYYVFITLNAASDLPKVGDPVLVSGSSQSSINGVHTVTGIIGNVISFPSTLTTGSWTDSVQVDLYFQTPIQYQQLQNPGPSDMTAVISSTLFGDKCLVAASFADGSEYVFYDGTIVADFKAGEISGYVKDAWSLANNIAAEINSGTDYTATVSPSSYPTTLSFAVTGGAAGTDTFTVVWDFGRTYTWGDGSSENLIVLANAIGWTTSNVATASALVVAINAALNPDSNPAGFVADNAGGTSASVTITPPAALSSNDKLSVYVHANATVTVNPIIAVLNVSSKPPTGTTVNAFTPTVDNTSKTGVVSKQLTNPGVPGSAAVGATGSFQIVSGTVNPQASATITVTTTNAGSASTVTVNGVVYTFVLSLNGAGSNSVLLGTTAVSSLTNLVAAINGQTTLNGSQISNVQSANSYANAAISGSVATVTSILGGTGGNAYTLATSIGSWTLSGANFSGGSDTNCISQIKVGSTSLMGGSVYFNSTPTALASAIAQEINNNTTTTNFFAVSQGQFIYITSVVGGVSVNGLTIEVDAVGTVCVDACAFFVPFVSGVASQNISKISPDSG